MPATIRGKRHISTSKGEFLRAVPEFSATSIAKIEDELSRNLRPGAGEFHRTNSLQFAVSAVTIVRRRKISILR